MAGSIISYCQHNADTRYAAIGANRSRFGSHFNLANVMRQLDCMAARDVDVTFRSRLPILREFDDYIVRYDARFLMMIFMSDGWLSAPLKACSMIH